MYTLSKQNTGNISFMFNRDMEFWIGFESISHTRHVQYNMNPIKNNIRLKLSEGKNRKDKYTDRPYGPTVVSLNDHAKLGKEVLIDTQAQLIIDKKNEKQLTYQKMLAQELSYMIQLETLNVNEFVTLPVISRINVVLPKKISEETQHFICFDSIAIYSKPESLGDIKQELIDMVSREDKEDEDEEKINQTK